VKLWGSETRGIAVCVNDDEGSYVGYCSVCGMSSEDQYVGCQLC